MNLKIMITLVAAISKNNCIGKQGGIPWNIPEDMKRMREITRGKVLIMGRKTWESIPKERRPLPDRTNAVITRDQNYALPAGVERYDTIDKALQAHAGQDIFGFGGQRVFEEMIKIADILDITLVDQIVDKCDAFFPEIDLGIWKEVEREDHEGYSFVVYKRK